MDERSDGKQSRRPCRHQIWPKAKRYDSDKLIHSESSDQTGMSKTSFVSRAYSFKDRFGIDATSNATFEFIFYVAGQQVAKTARIKGPIVQPPALAGTPQFEKKPYFFQGISVSAGFKDLDGLNPKPTCHLEIIGPLDAADSRSWITADVSCQSFGKSTYSCTVTEGLSSYRKWRKFHFQAGLQQPQARPTDLWTLQHISSAL